MTAAGQNRRFLQFPAADLSDRYWPQFARRHPSYHQRRPHICPSDINDPAEAADEVGEPVKMRPPPKEQISNAIQW
jgi:hypothetical protein